MTLKTFCIIVCILCICGMVISLCSCEGFGNLNGKAISLGGGTFAKMNTDTFVSQTANLDQPIPSNVDTTTVTAYTTAQTNYNTVYDGVKAFPAGSSYDSSNQAVICPPTVPVSSKNADGTITCSANDTLGTYCDAGQYWNPSTKTITKCQAGSYCPGDGNIYTCPTNSYCPDTTSTTIGTSAPLPCTGLSYSAAGASVCKTDCVVGEWGNWSACSVTCGSGTQTRTRTVTAPINGGAACPSTTQSQACNTQTCPVDCVVSAFGTCSAVACGTTGTKTRTVTTQPTGTGTACPALSQSCTASACPTNSTSSTAQGGFSCNAGYYKNGTVCTPCPTGTYRKMPGATSINECLPCPAHTSCPEGSLSFTCATGYGWTNSEYNMCGQTENCVISGWGEWSACSSTCQGGTQTRNAIVSSDERNGGTCTRQDWRACNNNVPCPVGKAECNARSYSYCSCPAGSNSDPDTGVEIPYAAYEVCADGAVTDGHPTSCQQGGCGVI